MRLSRPGRHSGLRCELAETDRNPMTASHDSPPTKLDRPIEVGPHDWTQRDFYRLMSALVVPRPVGWISTVSAAGVNNVAPYSFFNLLGSDPPYVGFGSTGAKDSIANLRDVPEFVVNIVSMHLLATMNLTAHRFSARGGRVPLGGPHLGAVCESPAVPGRGSEGASRMRGGADRQRPQHAHHAGADHPCARRSERLERRTCRPAAARSGLPPCRLGLCQPGRVNKPGAVVLG